jgi:hypothetical protein
MNLIVGAGNIIGIQAVGFHDNRADVNFRLRFRPGTQEYQRTRKDKNRRHADPESFGYPHSEELPN